MKRASRLCWRASSHASLARQVPTRTEFESGADAQPLSEKREIAVIVIAWAQILCSEELLRSADRFWEILPNSYLLQPISVLGRTFDPWQRLMEPTN